MHILEKKDAEIMLFELLERTLKKQSDINKLMDLARNNEHTIPMKGIRYIYDSIKNTLIPNDTIIMYKNLLIKGL